MSTFDRWGVNDPPKVLYTTDEKYRLRWNQYLFATSLLLFYLFLHQSILPFMMNLARGRPWHDQLHWSWIILAGYRFLLQRRSVLSVHPSIPGLFLCFTVIRVTKDLTGLTLNSLSWPTFSMLLTEGSLLVWCFLHYMSFPLSHCKKVLSKKFIDIYGALIALFLLSVALDYAPVLSIPTSLQKINKNLRSAKEKSLSARIQHVYPKLINRRFVTVSTQYGGWNPNEVYWKVASPNLRSLVIKIKIKSNSNFLEFNKSSVNQLQVLRSCSQRLKPSLISTYPAEDFKSLSLIFPLPFGEQYQHCIYELRLWGRSLKWPSLWILGPNVKWFKESNDDTTNS